MTFDIPNKDGLWVYNSVLTWQTWVKPTQYNNFIFYVCGGGGGGAAGQTGIAGTLRYGGGGGSAASLITLHSPSYLLPERIYINIGIGGLSGQAGTGTYICWYPNTNAANVIGFANGGATGSTLTGGAGVTATINQSIFSLSTTISSAGTNGGNGAVASNFSITSSCIYGGTGGGGVATSNVSYAGGNILASNIHPQLDGGIANGVAGNSGYFIKKPFTALGGTGSGGNSLGTGGIGGNGIWGSGGGGGGGGLTGGAGGKGGNGFVIIIGY